jgi:hypothetical protein
VPSICIPVSSIATPCAMARWRESSPRSPAEKQFTHSSRDSTGTASVQNNSINFQTDGFKGTVFHSSKEEATRDAGGFSVDAMHVARRWAGTSTVPENSPDSADINTMHESLKISGAGSCKIHNVLSGCRRRCRSLLSCGHSLQHYIVHTSCSTQKYKPIEAASVEHSQCFPF